MNGFVEGMKAKLFGLVCILGLACFITLKTNTITMNYYVQEGTELIEVEETVTKKWYEQVKFPELLLENYKLVGWIDEKDDQITAAINKNNKTYTAVVEPKSYNIVYFDSNPTAPNQLELTPQVIYTEQRLYTEPLNITYTLPDTVSMNFAYWSNGIEEVKTVEVNSEDVYLYPVYTPKEFIINYELKGGKLNNAPNSYTYGEGISQLSKPVKYGYIFKGWYTDDTYKNKIDIISVDLYGDLTLYARWEKIDVEQSTTKPEVLQDSTTTEPIVSEDTESNETEEQPKLSTREQIAQLLKQTKNNPYPGEGNYGYLRMNGYAAKLVSVADPNYKGYSSSKIVDQPGVCWEGSYAGVYLFGDHNTQGFTAITRNTTATWTIAGQSFKLRRVSVDTGYNENGLYYDDGTHLSDNIKGPICMYTCKAGGIYITFWTFVD